MFFKLYRLRNILGVGFHYTATVAVLAGSVILAPGWIIGTVTALTGILYFATIKQQKEFFEDFLIRHPNIHENSPRLGTIVQELYKKSGLKSADYPVYDFRSDDEKIKKDNSSFKKLLHETLNETMAKVHNAAAVNMGKPVIIISEPLLKLLDDEEEKAVLAHEFAHAAALHQHVSVPHNILGGTSRFINSATNLATAVMTGFVAMVLSFASYLASAAMFRKYHKHGNILIKDKTKLSPLESAQKKNLLGKVTLVGKIASTSVFSFFNPAYLPLFLMNKGLYFTSSALSGTLSRSMEYQADRGAVELGASPLALITSLRKMTIVNQRSKESMYQGATPPPPGPLTKVWGMVKATHPTVENRIERLSAIARRNGFSDAAIDQAVKAPLHVAESNNIPPEVLKIMMHAI